MKKAVLLLTITVFVFSLSFAEGSTMTKDAEGSLYNGVTFFDTGPEPDCTAARGSATGGAAEPSDRTFNGVTTFEMSESGAKGTCASEPSAAEAIKKMYNGVTVF